MKKIITSLVCLFALSNIGLVNLEKENSSSNSSLDLVKAELFDYPKDDLIKEPEFKKSFEYNFAHMDIGNPISDPSSVWNTNRGERNDGTKVKVAVIDTGIDIYHEDFLSPEAKNVKIDASNVEEYSLINPKSGYFYAVKGNNGNAYVKQEIGILPAYDEDTYDPINDEYYSHGTASASCIGAAINGMGGLGVAPCVDLLILRTDLSLISLDACVRYAADQGADVINMSLGIYEDEFVDGYEEYHEPNPGVSEYIESCISYAIEKDVTIVAAAGNECTYHNSYPACNKGVIGVGALDDRVGTYSSEFSNYNYKNATKDGDNNVDVMAPGFVYCANVPQIPPRTTTSSSKKADSFYSITIGTSFASPLTAGAVALYRAQYPSQKNTQVAETLFASCSEMGPKGWDTNNGFGRVDVKKFLNTGDKVLTVNIKPNNLKLHLNSQSEPSEFTLVEECLPSSALEIYKKGLWISENDNVVTVDEITGKCKAIAPGNTRIGFMTEVDCIIGYCDVTVIDDSKIVRLDSIELKEPLADTLAYFDETIGEQIEVIAHYTNKGKDKNVLANVTGLDTTKIGLQTVTISYTEDKITKTITKEIFVTNDGAIQKETGLTQNPNLTITSKNNCFKTKFDTITGDDNVIWQLAITGDCSYFGFEGSSRLASQIGTKKGPNPESIAIKTDKFINKMITKVEVETASDSALLDVKVNEVNFKSNGKTAITLNSNVTKYAFEGYEKGEILISLNNVKNASYIKSIIVTLKGDVKYNWTGDDQAKSYINFLKNYKTCSKDFAKREDVVTLVNEYNFLLQSAKDSKHFNESFIDNGNYKTTAINKLKVMVDEYNNSLKPGEEELVLVLSQDEQGKILNSFKSFEFEENKTMDNVVIAVIVLASILSLGLFALILLKSRKNHN